MAAEREHVCRSEPAATELDAERVRWARALLHAGGRAREPRACLEELLRHEHGLELGHCYKVLRDRHGPDSLEARYARALVELGEQLLIDADPAVHEWRANRRAERRKREKDEARREQAAAVVYVRALGYGRDRACTIVQEKYLGQTGRHKDTLLRALQRAARRGVFAGLYREWPTRAEARAALGWSEDDVPDGPLPETTAPVGSRPAEVGEEAPIHELLAPDGFVPLWGNRKEDRRKRRM